MKISGVYVHIGIRHSKQLVLTEELFTDGFMNLIVLSRVLNLLTENVNNILLPTLKIV